MNENFKNPNLDAMLKVVGNKLNVSPDTLKKQLQEGKFDNALKGLNQTDYNKFNQLMNNPQMAQKVLSAPQLQALYKKLTENNK